MRVNHAVAVACVLLITLAMSPPVNAGEILFVSDRDEPGNWDIYSIDVDTRAVRRLTTDPAIDNHPGRSPDGSRVVWSSTRAAGGGNAEGDFEIFIADWNLAGTIEATALQLTDNNVTDTHIPLERRHISDRHPHFSPDGLRIIYTAKYVCVSVTDTTWITECSIPSVIETVDPCGRLCEGIRIMDVDGGNLIEIDHLKLTAANPSVWPPRPDTSSRWVGHPSFSHDGAQIVFSGSVDGEGRNWEVYVMDWDGSNVSNLRQVTLESTYPDNANPIKMSGGAHFAENDATILFTSTRTEFGNSQLFEVSASAEKVAVSPAIRHSASSDIANDYVPEPLSDGRIVLTSDRDDYLGLKSCEGEVKQYTAVLDPGSAHVIRVEASGQANVASSGVRVHLDAFELNLDLLEENDVSTTYSGSWLMTASSPNASTGYYALTEGTGGEYVDIGVPSGVTMATLYLGATPSSGIARIFIDGTPIANGDALGDWSGIDLYTAGMSVSNDLDLIIISADGSTQTNLTDNDLADELLLIGDEVSWFCGLSPNLSDCTYLPKYFTIGQLWLMANSDVLPDNFPNQCLYAEYQAALDEFMVSGGNQLRPHNAVYWDNVLSKMASGGFDDEWVVLPAPVGFPIDNQAPRMPTNVFPFDGDVINGSAVSLFAIPSSDPDFDDPVTHDIYLGQDDGAMLIVSSNSYVSDVYLENLSPGHYSWRVVAKDCRGGLRYGPTWTFDVTECACDCQADELCDGVANVFDVVFAVGEAFRGEPYTPDPNPDCPLVGMNDANNDGSVNVFDVVRLVNMAFRAGTREDNIFDPCF